MQISSYGSSLPPSTQIIKRAGEAAKAPDSPISPEQINTAVDAGSDRVQQAGENREAAQTTRRTAATQIYSARSQQNQLDTYLAVASEGEVDSSSGSADISTVQQLDALAARNRLAENLDQRVPREPPPPPARPTPYVDVQA